MRLRTGWPWAAALFAVVAFASPAFPLPSASPTSLLGSPAARFVLRELGVPARLIEAGAGVELRLIERMFGRIEAELARSEEPAVRSLLAGDRAALVPGSAVEGEIRAALSRAIANDGVWRELVGTGEESAGWSAAREAFLGTEGAEAALWPAVAEGGGDLRLVSRRPDIHGGYIYSLHHSRTMRFETGTSHITYRSHPEAIEHLGFRVYTDAEGRIIEEFPGPVAFSRRLEILRRLSPDAALFGETRITLTQFRGGIPAEDYLRPLSRGEIPVARQGMWFRHDILVHGFAFSVLIPGEVWTAYRAELEASLRFAAFARASGDRDLIRAGDALLADRARATDQVTAGLNTRMFDSRGIDRVRHLADSWDGLVLGPRRLRAKIDELFAGRALSPEARTSLEEWLNYSAPDADRRRSLATRLLEFLGIPPRG